MEEIKRGHEGVVYKVGNRARKVFFESRSSFDDTYLVARKLSILSIPTFMKPLKLIYDDRGYLSAYDMEIMPPDTGKVSEMEIDKLLVNVRNIRKDLGTMAFHNILVKDFHRNNISVNGDKIYVYDFGYYKYNPDFEHAEEYNDRQLDLLIGYDALADEEDDLDPRDITYLLVSPFLASKEKYIEDYIDKNINGKYKTLQQYIRRR